MSQMSKNVSGLYEQILGIKLIPEKHWTFWAQLRASKLHNLAGPLKVNTNLPPILHHFQAMADYMKFSLATGGRLTLTPSLRVIPCEYRHKW